MQPADDFQSRYETVVRQLEALTAEVKRNDHKLRRSQQREMRLLRADNLEALIRELTDGLCDSYNLDMVSLVLCDPDHDIRHLLLAAGAPVEDFSGLVMVESLGGMAPQYVALRQVWLGPYAACDHQLLFPAAPRLASIAIIPLLHRRQLIGSINLGSSDPQRFTRGHAADFLEHLGIIAAYCIENVINRARLLRSGFTDVLTGWNNRRYLQVRLSEELARARRDQGELVCLMLDVDHFKRVNDTWGHAAGDAVLRELAQRIDSQVRASDVAARYGGEEFVVLMPNTGVSAGERLAERIRRAIAAAPFELPSGDSVPITVSIGIAAAAPAKYTTDLKILGDALVARADVALYRAKAGGRDQVRVAVEEQ